MAENKNPYEVRLEVLKTAKDLVLERYHQEKEVWEQLEKKFNLNLDLEQRKSLVKDYAYSAPHFPSEKNVLEAARELYTFVTSKE